MIPGAASFKRGKHPAAAGGGGTSVLLPSSASKFIFSADGSSYANARAGTGGTLNVDAGGGSNAFVGQYFFPAATYPQEWACWEHFLDFDTAALVGTITSAVLSLGGLTDTSDTNFTIEARLHDWGVGVTTADWVAGASLSTKTLLATFATLGFSTVVDNVFTDVAMAANINRSGKTRMLLCSDRQRTNTAPAGNEYVEIGGYSNSTRKPKLTVITV